MQLIILLSLVSGSITQLIFRKYAVSAAIPVFGYLMWSAHREFFGPHSGGGASFWPLDIVFAIPVIIVLCFIGAFVCEKAVKLVTRR